MVTLPIAIVLILIPFATLFTNPTWRKAQLLLVGAILTPGQRTVAAALRVMDRSDHRDYARYHEVLNRAVWSPARQRVSCWCCCSSTWTGATSLAAGGVRHGGEDLYVGVDAVEDYAVVGRGFILFLRNLVPRYCRELGAGRIGPLLDGGHGLVLCGVRAGSGVELEGGSAQNDYRFVAYWAYLGRLCAS